MHFKAAGFYKLAVVGPDGSTRQVAEFPNLITDAGLNRMGANSDYLQYCQVGSGSTAPTVLDTGLASYIAGTASTTESTNGAQASEPYYAWRVKTFSFGTGVAAGNIAEVGVGWAASGSLFSRALVLDSEGDPTTITVLSDESLYVTYEFRLYPALTDDTGEVTFTGGLGGTYDWIWRASDVTSGVGAWDIGASGTSMGAIVPNSVRIYNGTIGAITTAPSGTNVLMTPTAQAYVNNSLERRFDISLGLGTANLTGGIRSLRATLGPTSHQVQFDPAIPKTASDTLSLVVAHTWGRV